MMGFKDLNKDGCVLECIQFTTNYRDIFVIGIFPFLLMIVCQFYSKTIFACD
uniref:Uncharacterized protein n=1 Tax=Arion vulgaris TaxID=1028688 RepID=A0A0B6ZCG4_9EUPU